MLRQSLHALDTAVPLVLSRTGAGEDADRPLIGPDKGLRAHGLIKKVGRTYKYYLTKLGQRAIVAVLHLHETILLKGLAPVSP